ncbi:FecCD family ABC transporter permease [Ancylobacter oerskovii]|uniref:FecCD family ABC transporter permease n=1 Tax=Ancylobacter oerskovii TaxID=459519 RepID=A0ABW4Z083_9HYPH|nr:iron chelate uptake ABC transporter family permease subunit [Ancylobacter oerskovii]MBS7542859.1 iron chelate uptake ABC transporter family permease subunit [Ancylobacter oerskovii]
MLEAVAVGTVPERTARERRARLGLAACAALAAAAALASLAIGPVTIPVEHVLAILWRAMGGSVVAPEIGLRESVVVLDIRLPRTLMGLMVGAATATAGAVMQGIFRNPLADPGLIGVSSGAALAAVLWIVLGASLTAALPAAGLPAFLGEFGLPAAAFAGALLVTMVLHVVATREGRTSVATLLFAGIAFGAMAGAGTGILVFIASDQQLRDLTFWTMGSLGGATWAKLAAATPFVLVLLALAPPLARALDALALGEAAAFHVGVDVERSKRLAIAGVAAGAGAAVAAAGVIGFVGLVVPHLLRLLIGPGHRLLLPASALAGGALLLGADLVARTIAAPAELPLGIVTAAIGAPFFLWLLLRRRAELFG